jgi:iron complex outermembrane receptor protein
MQWNTGWKLKLSWPPLLATGSILSVAAISLPPPAFGQSAAPGATVELPPIDIAAPAPDRTANTEANVRARIDALAGGTALITRSDMTGRADVTIADTLATVPGIVVQSFFGGNDQPRVQMRGSGLQQNPVERGILILQDGLPLNRADGSYIVGFADPRQAQYTEIYRGYTANRLGATVLGGAINFTSPNGSSEPGIAAGVEGGSFGQVTTHARAGGRHGAVDALGQVSFSRRDGFRDHNGSERTTVNFNTGIKLNENISTRLFAGYTDLSFDIPGPLTWTKLKQDPTQIYSGPTVTPRVPTPLISNPGPNVVRDRPGREAEQFRAGSRTTATFGDHLFDIALGYSHTDDRFKFPIANGIRDTDGGDFTGVLRYAYRPDQSRALPLFEVTAQYVAGTADRKNYQNIAGNQGQLFGDNDLSATTLSLNAGLHIPVGSRLTFAPAIAYSHATRDSSDLFGAKLRPVAGYNAVTGAFQTAFARAQDTSYARSYDGWSPSFGALYDIAPNSTLFAAVSRSFEPPTHDDLLATINGTPFFSPGAPVSGVLQYAFATPNLKAQTATTVEAGWRGKSGRFAWNAVTYYSWVQDELLSLRDSSGTQLASVNADKTAHFGIELGLDVGITDALSARLAYTFQEFRFVDDPLYGNNRLAGAPRHNINAALRYALMPDWFVEGEVNWRPDDTPVDNANTLFNESWATLNLRTYYAVDKNVALYGEVRNVFDEVYASSTLITDRASSDQAAFLPGDGRAFIAGLRVRM